MKAFKYILFLLLILVIGLAIYVAVQPNSYEVKRSRTINAPAQVVYNHVIDFKTWEAWSSWKEADPDIVINVPENSEGIGGFYTWTDGDDLGEMKTTAANPFTSITQEMQYGDFPKSDVTWDFTPNEDGSTEVTWTISGKDLPFSFKAYSAFTGGMEKEIGPHYDRGLELLDSDIQKDMKRYTIKVEGITEHSGGFYLYNTASAKMANFKNKMSEMLPKVGGYAISNNIRMAGAPFVIYHKMDEVNDTVMFSNAIPTTSKIETTNSEILTGQLPQFKAVKTTLYGNYDNLQEAWSATMTYIEDNNLEQAEDGPKIEVYATDPNNEPNPANWITEIYIAIK